MTNKQRADLTFKDNLKRGRHGWVRLTPAYSVKIVQQILDEHPDVESILDPFSGTGTTGLVAGQHGLCCDLFDINPFLIWLATVKCATYTPEQLRQTQAAAAEIIDQSKRIEADNHLWFPPISNIDRWWSRNRLVVLAKIFHALNRLLPSPCQEKDLLLIGFCRLIIRWSNAAFNHQSMSFSEHSQQQPLFDEEDEICQHFLDDLKEMAAAAGDRIPGKVRALLHDSRHTVIETERQYDAIITSPPYANRMSYIRELRPYMYWLGYLENASDAGELDWEAIGGTWGIATSRLNHWTPENGHCVIPQLEPIIEEIAMSSSVLSQYVHKYFNDMSTHFANLYDMVASGGRIFYIIGNSKFYDTLVPAEQLYADMMKINGFEDITIKPIRKRNSKKELYEFLVSARKIS